MYLVLIIDIKPFLLKERADFTLSLFAASIKVRLAFNALDRKSKQYGFSAFKPIGISLNTKKKTKAETIIAVNL